MLGWRDHSADETIDIDAPRATTVLRASQVDNVDSGSDSKPSTPSPRQSGFQPFVPKTEKEFIAHLQATVYIEELNRKCEFAIQMTRLWRRFFLGQAALFEERTFWLREDACVAVSLDDYERVVEVQKEADAPVLWKWWGFNLKLLERSKRPGRVEFRYLWEPWLKNVYWFQNQLKPQPPKIYTAFELEEKKMRSEELGRLAMQAFESKKEFNIDRMRELLEGTADAPGADPNSCPLEFFRAKGKEGPSKPVWGSPKQSKVKSREIQGKKFAIAPKNYYGWTILHFVAAAPYVQKQGVEIARMLLSFKADASLTDAGGGTALHVAAFTGNIPIMDVLLEESSVHVEVADADGCSALLVAARARQGPAVRRLVQFALPKDIYLELIASPQERHTMLVTRGACLRLHALVAEGNVAKIVQLLEDGEKKLGRAWIGFADSLGRQAFHVAALGSSAARVEGVLRVLKQKKADINAVDSEGCTPLHLAARQANEPVVQSLMMLLANPNIMDKNGYTPLMMAVSKKPAQRTPAPYSGNGIVVGRPVGWRRIRRILEWEGEGEVPGPKPRGRRFFETQKSYLDGVKKSRRKRDEDEEEEEAEEEEENAPPEEDDDDEFDGADDEDHQQFIKDLYNYEQMVQRANALVDLGFGDQDILIREGTGFLVNKCDKLQLFDVLFFNADDFPPKPPTPQEERLELLFNNFVGPALQMSWRGRLTIQIEHLLRYVLMSCLGPHGAIFGALLGMGGVTQAPYPTWSVVERTILNEHDTVERASAVQDIGFRRYPGPHKALWCGSAWNKYELPREADYAPWRAFEYIDRENDGLIAQQGCTAGNASDEALKNHMLSIFNKKSFVHRGDRLQLANRIFVNEALFILQANDERAQLVGEELLCPLIDRALSGLPEGVNQDDDFPDWVGLDLPNLLKYVSAQVIGPPGVTWENPRKAYERTWHTTRDRARSFLTPPLRHNIIALTDGVREIVTGPVRQDAIETSGDVRWLRTKQTVRAYIEMRKTGVIESTEEFLEVVASLGAAAGFFFWREAYGLLLWGRAVELKPLLEANLRSRLPSEGLTFEVILKPREEMRAPPLPEKDADLEERWKREMDPYIQQQLLKEILASKEISMAAGSVTNVLTARVICNDEDVLIDAFHALLEASKELPPPPLTILPKAMDFINKDATWSDLASPTTTKTGFGIDMKVKSTQWRVRNGQQLGDHWNIGELNMYDGNGLKLVEEKQIQKVICSHNYDDHLLNVIYDGENCTIGHADPRVWAGDDGPEGRKVGGSWLGYVFSKPQEVKLVRMAQGATEFNSQLQGVQLVWLEAFVEGEWMRVQNLKFTAPIAEGVPVSRNPENQDTPTDGNRKYVRLAVHRIINGFALPEQAKKTEESPGKRTRGLASVEAPKKALPAGVACPLAGRSIWLTVEADAGKSERGSKLKQLFEVELTMKNSLDARVLAEILDLQTAEQLMAPATVQVKKRRATQTQGSS